MACELIDFATRQRRELPPAAPNPFATALADIASLNAALFGAAAAQWAGIAALYRAQRADDDCRPCDSEGFDGPAA
jgi:hypothetical protein